MKPEKKDLGRITQISKILKELRGKKKILNFGKVEKDYYQGLIYRIYIDKRRKFDIRLQFSKRSEILLAAEIAESNGWQVVIIVGENCTPKRIDTLVREELSIRKKGISLEVIFQKQLERLIKEDEDFGKIISSVSEASKDEDVSYRIDRFLILSNGKKVPIQIKSSIHGQAVHKRKGSSVPSLVYHKGIYGEILKKRIIKIILGYGKEPKIIEHI